METFHIFASPRIGNYASIELQMFGQKPIYQLGGAFLAGNIFQTPLVQFAGEFYLQMQSFAIFFQPSLNNWKYLLMWRIGLSLFLTTLFKVGALIPNRWLPREYALVDSCHHAIATALFADGIVKFSDTGKERFKKFCHRLIADRFGDGMQSNAIGCQNFSNGKMVISISRKPIYTQHHEGLDIVFILATKLKSLKKLLSIIKT